LAVRDSCPVGEGHDLFLVAEVDDRVIAISDISLRKGVGNMWEWSA
jgi:hypothetical protein